MYTSINETVYKYNYRKFTRKSEWRTFIIIQKLLPYNIKRKSDFYRAKQLR